MRQFTTALILTLLTSFCASAQGVIFHNEAADTTRITALLEMAACISDPNERVEALAREFLGTPYVAATLESGDGVETLRVNLDQLDCTTLVETVMALAITAGEGRRAWQDFVYNLRNTRYRGGQIDGYPSRLHYISDWVVDNVHRGNFSEVTSHSPLAGYEIKTIDFMTANRGLYPALADDDVYAKVKDYEIGYRSHRFPIIKTKNVAKSASFLRSGDIVALCSAKKGLDVSHLGIIIMEKGVPHLLHASITAKEVVIDRRPLADYLARNRSLTGIRVIRLNE